MPARSDQVIHSLLKMIDCESMLAIRQHALDEMVRLTDSAGGFYATVEAEGPTAYWYDCAARREAVIRNNGVPFAAPDGTEPDLLLRDLTVPLFDGERLAALVGVNNRATNYSAQDAAFVTELAAGLQRVLIRKRLHDLLQDSLQDDRREPPA